MRVHLVCYLIVLMTGASAWPDDFPQFQVPGQTESMRQLNKLFGLHHSPKTICTLWDGWVPMSTLWPALGDKPTADVMRSHLRHSLNTRQIDRFGYVTMNQHRGHAHPGGWPFPTWQQAGGYGWHFTLVGDPYANMLHTPLASADGWTFEGTKQLQHDPQTGLSFLSGGLHTELTSPATRIRSDVSPFLIIEWTQDQLGENARPKLHWTTEAEPIFSESRMIDLPAASQLGGQYAYASKFCIIPTYQHAEWKGFITRLRVSWNNDTEKPFTIRNIHSACDSRHPITNSLYIRGCYDYYRWTRDIEFLKQNLPRLRIAIEFAINEFDVNKQEAVRVTWVGHDGRTGFINTPETGKVIHHGRGIGNNYWDLLPFGHDDFLATLYLFDALKCLAKLESMIESHPDWGIDPASEQNRSHQLNDLANRIQAAGQKRFWNVEHQRFVACIDSEGVAHDYGFTFLNLEAISYGFASPVQSKSILNWINGERVIAGDTAQGDDIYHWRFAPRATTKRNIEWYSFVWHGPDTIPWGGQVQDGGAVLGFSYHDLMARLQVLGPDNAWQRLQEILNWFEEVQSEGGYRQYYAKEGRGSLQGGGTPGGLGIDHEFLESVLVPQVMLYGFLGFNPDATHLSISPQLPSSWPELSISNIHYLDHVLSVTVNQDEIQLNPIRVGEQSFSISYPHDENSTSENTALFITPTMLANPITLHIQHKD